MENFPEVSSCSHFLAQNEHGKYYTTREKLYGSSIVNKSSVDDPQWKRVAEKSHVGDDLSLLRYLFDGLIFPKKENLMVRCRMTGGELSSAQLSGIASIARKYGAGSADVTTRGNLQVRDVAFEDGLNVLRDLMRLEVAPCVAGVNNLRNITVTPSTGFDPYEVMDVMPIAKALSEALIYHASLQGLPGKFNMALDSGGGIEVSAEANDLGFYAESTSQGPRFRMRMAGASGLDALASDVGVSIAPDQVVPVAAAVVSVFLREGDFSQRRRSRLRYLVDRVGSDRMLEWVNELLVTPLERDSRNHSESGSGRGQSLQYGAHRLASWICSDAVMVRS